MTAPSRRLTATLLALAFAPAVLAAPEAAELPPEPVVQRLLDSRPAVQRAAAQLRAEEAVARGLVAGPQEWTLRGDVAQRRVEPAPAARDFEWRAGVERPIRSGDKARADVAIGERGVEAAKWMFGDARHETARALMAGWFDWLRAEATLSLRQQADNALRQITDAVRQREALGDAARLERIQAESALAQSQSLTVQAEQTRDASRRSLQQLYPGLPLTLPELPEPAPLDGATDWRASILENSHELGMSRAEADKALALADRSRLDRRPDPTVGLAVAQERGGDERLLVLTLSMPIPGEARREQGNANQARAEAARAQFEDVRLRVQAEALNSVERVQTAVRSWQAAAAAARQANEVAKLTAQAQQLGERALADVLLAQRLASETRLQAQLTQIDALEARDRVWLDAHTIWTEED